MSEAVGVCPAQVSLDADGVARSSRYDDVYHPREGAAAQARHVFLGGNGLPGRWRDCARFTIVETGFGLGVNFLATWQARDADSCAPRRLHYVAVDRHPPEAAMLERFHARDPQRAAHARELIRHWPPLVRGFHRLEFAGGRLVLTLLIGEASEMLAELDASADAIFLDGFAPQKNPAMWSQPLFDQLARLSAAGATAATWTVAGEVRARLAAAGFHTSKRPGFGTKREMLVAQRTGGQEPARARGSRSAVVIGAGLAGAWCAHALARRGWDVDVVERSERPAAGASGNTVGAVRPALNLADNVNAQIARAAFLAATRMLAASPELASFWRQTGVLHVAAGAAERDRMARIDAAHAYPRGYAAAVDAAEARARAGTRVDAPGWWIPLGGWAQPAGLCAALLRVDGGRIRCQFMRTATRLTGGPQAWHVHDRDERVIAAGATLILAAGPETNRLGVLAPDALIPVRGQITHLPPHPGRRLPIVVCGDGYVAPLPDGGHCVGATFQPNDASTALRAADHKANLARLERMLPGFCSGIDAGALGGRAAVRAATADRLPICGPSPGDDGGVYLAAGLGARGLVFAPLCAEVLAAQLDGEPNPLERRLIRALDPARLTPAKASRAGVGDTRE